MFDPTLHLPLSLAMFDGIFHAPSGQELSWAEAAFTPREPTASTGSIA